ncbi:MULTISPECIES: VWA domain-containing protein [Roseobacteraceae]|uniref:vWA domain-containing protein n=1 Tax=Roseobacteraceae TaxID=2854170 RepID=UPI001D0107F8|nr:MULTISPECIES: VWA domain-containing protein [Roseobacteraceae]
MRMFWVGAVGLVLGGQVAQAEQANTIIVMDGSGSMWGQIDGRPKLEIARQTLAEVLVDFPPERGLGLLAYGHRRKGDCSDIELLVAPTPGTASELLSRANTMRFLGKTPLTEAVRRAALDLRSTEDAATVILITDGLETCAGDPCALGRELEQSGVDFTAHVVGFGLQGAETAALECLALETGGRYFDAGDARGLRDALNQTLTPREVQQAEAALPPAQPATLDAPEIAGRAMQIEVRWSGPAREGDYIDIVPFDGAGTHAFDATPVVADSDTVMLTMPANLGDYVLRYVQPLSEEEQAMIADGTRERTLALRNISVVDIDNFLRAPDVAGQGAMVSVDWAGPKGFLGLYHASQTNLDAWLAGMSLVESSPVEMQMPLDEGDYTLRYIVEGSGYSSAELAVENITVTAAQISFLAPDRVRPGVDFTLIWSGPGGPRDWIDLVDPGTDGLYSGDGYSEYSYTYLRNSTEDRAITLTAPDVPGTYELRYIAEFPPSGRDDTSERALLFRQGLTVAADALDWSPDISETVAATAMPVADEVALPASPEGDAATSGFDDVAIGDDLGYLCEEQLGCLIEDRKTGVSFFLRPGWGTDFPYRDGPEAPVRINFFDTASEARLSLNAPPEVTEGTLCLPSTMGPVCNLTPDEPAALLGATLLLQTIQPLN